jgi:diguanylate cyclase (GGDEF)-like protein/PAS domain S-box-containing protein
MSLLAERYNRLTGPQLGSASATLLFLLASVGFVLRFRPGLLHYPDPTLTTGSLVTKLAWIVCSCAGLSIGVYALQHRRKISSGLTAGALISFVAVEAIDRKLAPGPYYAVHPSIFGLLAATGFIAVVVFICGLVVLIDRIIDIVQNASSRENELRFAAAAESSADSVLMYDSVRGSNGELRDFKLAFLNNQAERMIGAPRESVLGKHIRDVFPAWGDSDLFEKYKRVVETNEPISVELAHPLFENDGEARRFDMRIVKLLDGIAITITDVTVRLQNKEELKQALNFNKSIIASSPFSIIVTDKKGLITSINPAAERMLWYQESDLLGHANVELHDPQELAQRAEDLSTQFGIDVYPDHHVFRIAPEKGLIDEREWTYIRKDGSRVPVQLVVTALRDSDECITGFVGISYDLTERKRADEYIYHVAHHDPLTGLPTRTLLRDRLEICIERTKRSGDHLALLMVDLDNFKRVNDSLGHHAGDTVLCEISKRLKACVRKADTVARMGGDEFVVLLPDLRSEKDADEICQKLLSAVAQPIRIGKHEIIVTASVGIGVYPSCDDVDTLFKNADLAMYRVKATGRNGSQMYTPGIGMQGLQQLQMESALRNALEAQEFEILYQPQISFTNGRLLGVEALLRWNSAEFGMVGPTTFVPIAEETGLIVPIGGWILLQSCKEIAALQRRLGFECSLAVNISPRQFQQKDFPASVEHALLTSGLKPEQLELEITEQLLMVDSEESLEIMQRVRRLGVRFAIDDFGTGFSNMGYITRFAVDRIKIDRSFVSRCDVDENSRAVTAAIIALAHSLQIEVIAEGVESEHHIHMLEDMRCDQAQGYFYSQPLRLADVQAFALQNLQTTSEKESRQPTSARIAEAKRVPVASLARA